MSFGKWMDKHILIYLYNEILLSNKMKLTSKRMNHKIIILSKGSKILKVNIKWLHLYKILDDTTNL